MNEVGHERLMTIADVSTMLGVPVNTVYGWLSSWRRPERATRPPRALSPLQRRGLAGRGPYDRWGERPGDLRQRAQDHAPSAPFLWLARSCADSRNTSSSSLTAAQMPWCSPRPEADHSFVRGAAPCCGLGQFVRIWTTSPSGRLRHSFVAIMVAAGCNVREVSEWAGHNSVPFTLTRYGGLFEDGADAAVDRLDARLGDKVTGAYRSTIPPFKESR
jgi:hypothetical protein